MCSENKAKIIVDAADEIEKKIETATL